MTIVVYVTNINKDGFSYTVRRCDNGHDKHNWVAIAIEYIEVVSKYYSGSQSMVTFSVLYYIVVSFSLMYLLVFP